MGYRVARVDGAGLRLVAEKFDAASELIGQAAGSRLIFDGPLAGRSHVTDGAALRRALDGLVTGLAHWSRAAAEVGAGLRVGADRYADAEQHARSRIG